MPRHLSAALLFTLAGASIAFSQASTQPAATAPASQPTTIPWSDAKNHVGKTVTVSGPVIATHTSTNGKNITLNVGKDFPDKERFSVFLPAIDKPDDLYKGRTISVTGKIELYRDSPQIKAAHKDITVEK